jgi:hypothetical protein
MDSTFWHSELDFKGEVSINNLGQEHKGPWDFCVFVNEI